MSLSARAEGVSLTVLVERTIGREPLSLALSPCGGERRAVRNSRWSLLTSAATRLNSVEAVAAAAADEGDGTAAALFIGPAHAGAQWQPFDAPKFFRVL